MKSYIAYYRVSTDKQGRSGLGLEAQKAAVANHLATVGGELLAEFTEVESGKKNDRPELAKALAKARRSRAVLVFAKLDRLARNARFLLGIVESGVEVVFCDFPVIPEGPTGKFILTQMAAVAELEAGMTSIRTKAALAAYKARGGLLGAQMTACRNLTPEARLAGARRSAALKAEQARREHAEVIPRIEELLAEGLSLAEVADQLNAEGVERTGSRRGRGEGGDGVGWDKMAVWNITRRLSKIGA